MYTNMAVIFFIVSTESLNNSLRAKECMCVLTFNPNLDIRAILR